MKRFAWIVFRKQRRSLLEREREKHGRFPRNANAREHPDALVSTNNFAAPKSMPTSDLIFSTCGYAEKLVKLVKRF